MSEGCNERRRSCYVVVVVSDTVVVIVFAIVVVQVVLDSGAGNYRTSISNNLVGSLWRRSRRVITTATEIDAIPDSWRSSRYPGIGKIFDEGLGLRGHSALDKSRTGITVKGKRREDQSYYARHKSRTYQSPRYGGTAGGFCQAAGIMPETRCGYS
jgi:hypothetical protein